MGVAERSGLVTVRGNPLTLLGNEAKVGDRAPSFNAVDNAGQVVQPLQATEGKVRILAAVPSLDTPVCDTETRRFNQEAAALGENVEIVTISMDLPFAQKRWCGAAGVERVKTYSDHREASFGENYGVLIKQNRLLARSVFVVDKQGKVVYSEIVPELTSEPNYDKALAAARAAL